MLCRRRIRRSHELNNVQLCVFQCAKSAHRIYLLYEKIYATRDVYFFRLLFLRHTSILARI